MDQGGYPADDAAAHLCFPSFLQETPAGTSLGNEVTGSFTLPTAGLEGNVNGGRPSGALLAPGERRRMLCIWSLSCTLKAGQALGTLQSLTVS